jgi:MFS family permease
LFSHGSFLGKEISFMEMERHRTRTLWLAGALHAFTHVFQVALLPLYLPIQRSFGLASVSQATLLVTVMLLSYFLPSYPMGMMADRFSRKWLLAVGLLINALGFIGLSLAPSYGVALGCVAIAGLGGSFFHPAATAWIASLFPTSTGRALGLIGVGASVGFFVGPLYSGWRATATGDWRTPVLELGVAGVVMAGVFAWLANSEPPGRTAPVRPAQSMPMFPTTALWGFFIFASFAFSLRDFAGMAMGSLGSLFLQRAHGLNMDATGTALSCIYLASIVSNPLMGHLSDRGRLRWTCTVLLIATVIVAMFPHLPRRLLIPAYLVYGFFFISNYPMVEAALMESVPDSVRGRVFGLFITIGGFIGNLSHWLVGRWVESFGAGSGDPAAYYQLYGFLSLLILFSMAGLPCLHAIRKREHAIASPDNRPALEPAVTPPQSP